MSIGALSRSLGSGRLRHPFSSCAAQRRPAPRRRRRRALATPAERLPVDFAANAASLGAQVIRAETIAQLRAALADTAEADGPVVICVETDRYDGVPAFEGWWEVPVAEISD